MASQAYYQWVNAGRPYRLAQPIIELKALARRHGIEWLGDIGNQDHLTNEPPHDHTPFTVDAWPAPLPGYVVTACDIGSTIGWTILADAKAGRIDWVKYINCHNVNYDVRSGWQPGDSGDWHTHISIKTDWCDRSIGDYDPFAKPNPGPPPNGGGGGGDDLPVDQQTFDNLLKGAEVGVQWQPGMPGNGPGPRGGIRFGDTWGWLIGSVMEIKARLDALEAKGRQ